MRDGRQIEVTRIQARQAVAVAIITAVSSIVATLLATRSFDQSHTTVTPDVANDHTSAPLIFVASSDPGRASANVEDCKRKTAAEMNARRGKVIATGASWMALEWRAFGIMVMCTDDVQRGSIIVAGMDSKVNGDLAISLRAAILESSSEP